MKKVTIVIPNYNGYQFLETCMNSLRAQTCQDFEVLVVDNASVDESVPYLRENYPEVRVDVMETNLGFAGGVNYGILQCKTPYVILLNNDTESDPHYVEEMIKAIEKDDRIFSVSSSMISFYKRNLMDDAGDLYTMFGWAVQRGIHQPVKAYRKPKRVFSACAGAAIYRRALFDEIGIFDEMHFAYLEDIDLGFRANIKGYKNTYAPKAIVYHVGSGTSGSKYNPFKVRLTARNSLYLHYKNLPNLLLLLNAPIFLLGYIIKICFFSSMGLGKEYLSGLKEGLKTIRKCKRVKYERKNFKNYLDIEMQMFFGTFAYTFEFLERRVFNKEEK